MDFPINRCVTFLETQGRHVVLNYFPAVYPDELLYSVLARYVKHAGGNRKCIIQQLFGTDRIRSGIAFQSNLRELSNCLPKIRELSPKKIAQTTTLFPYFYAFMSDARRNSDFEILAGSASRSIQLRLGRRTQQGVGLAPFLRYCLRCRADMLDKYGELYWRRSHQLPGVLVCADHDCPLVDSSVVSKISSHDRFIAANEVNCPYIAKVLTWAGSNELNRQIILRIAKLSSAFLMPQVSLKDENEWRAGYRAALFERGFGETNGNIDIVALQEAFAMMFGDILSVVPELAPNRWIKGIITKSHKTSSPLHHIAIIIFIKLTKTVDKPFGNGPWICSNPLADHYNKYVIHDCRILNNKNGPIGVFHCDCGYVFSLHPGKKDGKVVRELGPLFDSKLKEMIIGKIRIDVIACMLGVEVSTVISHAKRLGLSIEMPIKRR